MEFLEGGVLFVARAEVRDVCEEGGLRDSGVEWEGGFVEGEDGVVPVTREDGGGEVEGVGVLGVVRGGKRGDE